MSETWKRGVVTITGPEDWDRAIVHLWGDSLKEFKRAFPHLLTHAETPTSIRRELHMFPEARNKGLRLERNA